MSRQPPHWCKAEGCGAGERVPHRGGVPSRARVPAFDQIFVGEAAGGGGGSHAGTGRAE